MRDLVNVGQWAENATARPYCIFKKYTNMEDAPKHIEIPPKRLCAN